MRPDWVASTLLVLAGIGMLIYGHFSSGSAYDPFIIFGILVLAFGVTLSAYSGGIKHALVLVSLFGGLAFLLILVDVYNLWGLRGWA